VKDGVKALLNYKKLARAQDATVAAAWLEYLDTNRTFKRSAELDQQVATLTTAQVNAAVRKYLKPDAFSSVAAGDFKK